MTHKICFYEEVSKIISKLSSNTRLIWATSWQNQQNGMCAQRRLRSAWASAQSDQSLCSAHAETLDLELPLSAQRRLWSDWADAQADLSLHWAHRSFFWFCHEVAHLCFSVCRWSALKLQYCLQRQQRFSSVSYHWEPGYTQKITKDGRYR